MVNKAAARPALAPSIDTDDDIWINKKTAIDRNFQRTIFHHGAWKSSTMKAIDETLYTIINFPPEYFADLQVRKGG